jgi:hypothetical protein
MRRRPRHGLAEEEVAARFSKWSRHALVPEAERVAASQTQLREQAVSKFKIDCAPVIVAPTV